LEKARKWNSKNRAKWRTIKSAANARRRALKKGAGIERSAGKALIQIRWALAGFLDVPESEIHLDHITPLKRGGAHADDNLRLLPARLNLIKGDKLDEEVTDPEFRAWVFGPPTFE
jgi:5-methylcytosine-specific restriction endonuclease McrA